MPRFRVTMRPIPTRPVTDIVIADSPHEAEAHAMQTYPGMYVSDLSWLEQPDPGFEAGFRAETAARAAILEIKREVNLRRNGAHSQVEAATDNLAVAHAAGRYGAYADFEGYLAGVLARLVMKEE